MLTLTGTLRQAGTIKTKEGTEYRKLWVETETPAEGDRPGELQIHEFMFQAAECPKLPDQGGQVSVDVRAYVRGRDIAYKALRVRLGTLAPENHSKAVAVK
jgi:hypothetical protein